MPATTPPPAEPSTLHAKIANSARRTLEYLRENRYPILLGAAAATLTTLGSIVILALTSDYEEPKAIEAGLPTEPIELQSEPEVYEAELVPNDPEQ